MLPSAGRTASASQQWLDFGAEPSRPASLLCTLRTHQSPGEWQHSLTACSLALAARDSHPLDFIKWFPLIHCWFLHFHAYPSATHRYLCLRFKRYLATSPARLEARMDSLLSFPVGLFHLLQHAGLSRRSPNRRHPPGMCRARTCSPFVFLTEYPAYEGGRRRIPIL